MALSFAFDASKETPQSTAAKRALIAQLMGTIRTPKTIGEGFSAIGDGIVANVEGGRAREAEQMGQASANDTFGALTAMLTGQGGAAPSTASGATQAMAGGDFMSGLINSESGGNWGALNDEGYGGRLQFGDARLADAAKAGVIPPGVTGAQFAQMSPEQQQAVEQWHFSDIDQQAAGMGLDRYYGQVIAGVPINAESVRAMAHLGGIGGAQKFVTSGGQYNPADSNGTRLSDYGAKFGGATQAPAPVQVASLDQSIGLPSMPAQAFEYTAQGLPRDPDTGYIMAETDPRYAAAMSGQTAQLPPIGPAAGPSMAPPPQQVAQAAPAPMPASPAPVQSQQGPSLQMLMEAAANPWLNDSQKAIINTMISEQMQTQQQANDPLRQLQIQQAQRSLETPAEQWQKLDDNTLYNQATGETKPIEGGVGASMFEGTGMDAQAWNILQTADPASREYATAYSIIAQPKPQMVQTENGMMLVPVAPQLPAWLVPPGGSAPSQPAAPTDTLLPNDQQAPALVPQGQSQANPSVFGGQAAQPANGMAGPGQLIPNTKKPSTEAQQRNEMLGTVLTSDLETINNSFDALSEPSGQLLSMIPGGLGNPWQSEEYQQAANAVSSSVANILYSVSGASANPGETENQIRNLTPQWGDKPGTIADKKRRLNIFVSAVAAASGNPELIAKAREESLRGLGGEAPSATPAETVAPPSGVSPDVWAVMTPEERALWN